MATRAGSADLPLHGGRVPRWLGYRMTRLGAVITQAIVHHYGRDEYLRRLANPFWFQSFGAVMGMDWHSSGITTSVIGALKRGLSPLSGELGIHVCGGRGSQSRKTPHELVSIADRVGLDGDQLSTTSRLVADALRGVRFLNDRHHRSAGLPVNEGVARLREDTGIRPEQIVALGALSHEKPKPRPTDGRIGLVPSNLSFPIPCHVGAPRDR